MIGYEETNKPAVDAERQLQAHYLSVLDRLLPRAYLDSLKSPGPGYEQLQGFAKLCERLSLAVAHYKVGGIIGTSAGPQRSRCHVALSRSAPGTLAVTVKAGSIVRASKGNRDFVLLGDVVFAALDVGPHNVIVEAVAAGYEWNIPGPVTLPGGVVLPGEIDTAFSVIQDPPYTDASIVVAQVDDATGGQDAVLDEHAIDRGLRRSGGETDPALQLRITTLPDTVSPGAFNRLLHALLDPLGATFELIEVWDQRFQTCWNGPNTVFPAPSTYAPNLFAYNDPRPPPAAPTPFSFYGRWMSGIVGVIVVVPVIGVLDLGMAYNDTAATPAGFKTGPLLNGLRAYGAWNVPASFAAGAQGAYNGFDVGVASLYKSIYDSLQAIKAAGVPVTVELAGQ